MPAILNKEMASLTVPDGEQRCRGGTEQQRSSKAEEPGLKTSDSHDLNKILALSYLIWGFHARETYYLDK